MVVRTGVVVCGRADGLHRPIERFRFELLSGSIGPDSGRGRDTLTRAYEWMFRTG